MSDILKNLVLWACGIFAISYGINACSNTEAYKTFQANGVAEQVRRETPHVIRQMDGCSVYAFESAGGTHYFTRCPLTTTTERSYNESCGKNCSRAKSETIVTENK